MYHPHVHAACKCLIQMKLIFLWLQSFGTRVTVVHMFLYSLVHDVPLLRTSVLQVDMRHDSILHKIRMGLTPQHYSCEGTYL